jgi:uncharacterized membrane protein YkvA (DUF1232 family)
MSKDYSSSYSDDSFWDKFTNISSSIGCSVLRTALYLYYILRLGDAPPWAKAAIIGALGYFVCPIDAIPDFLPGIGYTDDMAIMVALFNRLEYLVDGNIKRKVNSLLPERCRK